MKLAVAKAFRRVSIFSGEKNESGSCNAQAACSFAKGDIGRNSCNGAAACCDSVTCRGAENSSGTGNVGNNSCNGFAACVGVDDVGNRSCNERYSCFVAGIVGRSSCNDVRLACDFAIEVGDNVATCDEGQTCL